MTTATAVPSTFHTEEGVEVEAVLISTADEARAIRELTSWHEGQIRLITYPTADPVIFVGDDQNDLARFGRKHIYGQYLAKGPAGEITPIPAITFEETFKAGAAA